MGQAFGYIPNNGFRLYFNPDVTPDPLKPPSFDPMLGFPNGRKERVMQITEEEMISAKIPLEDRDYCAHKLLEYRTCCKDNWPFAALCAHEKHEFLHCKHEDFIIRMKEYERERRLKVREKKQQQLQQQEIEIGA